MRLQGKPIALVSLLFLACAGGGETVENAPGETVNGNTKPDDPGMLAGAKTIRYLGADFSEATFADPDLEYGDLVESKIPSWNRQAISNIIVRIAVPLVNDLDTSQTRNQTIRPDQLIPLPESPAPTPLLTVQELQQRLEPYVEPQESGPALVFWIQSLHQEIGVTGHYIVFQQDTGEVLLQAQIVGPPMGTGTHHYYLNGLQEISEAAMEAINKESLGEGSGEGENYETEKAP